MRDEIFTTVKLPICGEATVFEGKGKHYFKAMLNARGDSILMIKYLILEIVQINGKKLTEQQLDEMHLRDISYLSTVIATMMSNDFPEGL
jgi:hypothetical protein